FRALAFSESYSDHATSASSASSSASSLFTFVLARICSLASSQSVIFLSCAARSSLSFFRSPSSLVLFFAGFRVLVSKKRASSSDSPSSSASVIFTSSGPLCAGESPFVDASASFFSSFGFGLAFAKDLKISDVSRFNVGCLVDDDEVMLPAELGLEESSLFNVGGRFDVLDVVEVVVFCRVSSLIGLNFWAGASDMGGLFPV